METDLNLLFGVLAMQLEFVSSKQFAEACGLWSVSKSRSLADVFSDQKWLTDEERRIVEGLIQRKLKKHGGDAREALGAEADLDARDSMREAGDEDVNRTLSFLPPSIAHVRVGRLEDTLNYEPETRSRYTLTRVHGEGGVGRVWRAHDNRLNRQVALKEIRPDREVSVSSWQRFIKEAQVTGQLEHPNIVPVYEMTTGGAETDETFYTMRFVNGRTLSAEINEFRRRRQAGKTDRLQLRRLLQAFCGVCNAVAYAHSRGVVHRDLKPSNVMLGPFGEVVVLDWGLAKMLDQPEPDQALQRPSPISVTDEANAHQTVDGLVLGTLTYMAPEQAAGRLDLIDRRTDVYGLGAILFAIVTGQHPRSSKGENTEEIRRRIIEEPSPSARGLDPSVPKALSSICAKAMATERRDRFQSAEELADDVQRWLADEPVSSYRESPGERLGRIMRRHRTLTQAVSASLLVIAIVASLAFIVVRHARENEELAKQDAIRRFREARETVDRTLTSTADVLRYFPGARALRARLLEQAVVDYEKFVSEDSDDPEIRAETARAWGRLGDLRQLLGQDEEAEHAYLRGEEWLRGLLAEGDSPLVRMELAYCMSRRADVYRGQDKVDQAHSLLGDALVLAADAEQVPGYRSLQGQVLFKQAQLQQHLSEFDAALDLFRQAEAYFHRLVTSGGNQDPQDKEHQDKDPQHNDYRNWLAKSRSLQGQVHVELSQHATAAKMIEQAIAEYELLVEADPDSVAFLEGLAFSQINLANAIGMLSREDEQQEALRAAIDGFNTLLGTMPGVGVFRQSRGIARASYGMSLNHLGYNPEAQEQLDWACGEFQELYNAELDPDNLYLLAATSVGRAQLYRDLDDDAEAYQILTNTIKVYQQELLLKNPGNADYRRGLGAARRQLALVLYKTKRYEEAQGECERAIQAFNDALELMPEDAYSLDGRASAYECLADAYRQGGQLDPARMNFEIAITQRERLQQNPEFRLRLIKLLFKSGEASDRTRGLELAAALSREFPDSGTYAAALGAGQCLAGDFDAGIATLRRAETKRLPPNSTHEFWLALAYLGRSQEGDLEQARAAYKLGDARTRAAAPGHVELIELRERVDEALAKVQQP